MTIKTTEQTEIKVITTYVSADGKEWETKEACLEWEKGIECVAKIAWNKIPKIEVSTCDCGLDYSNEDEEAYIVIPRNHDDIIAIENYCRVYANDSANIDDSDIGKATILNFGYDHDWVGVTDVEKHLARLNKFFEDAVEKITKE